MPSSLHALGHDVVWGVVAWEAAAPISTRWVTYGAVLLAAGGSLFLAAIHDRQPDERRLLAAVVAGAALVGALGTAAGAFFSAAEISGMGGAVVGEPAILLSLLQSPVGAAPLVRLAGLALLLAAVPAVMTGRGTAALLVGGTTAVLSFALSGHTVTAEPRWLALISDACHTLAASLWFGGLVFLGIVLQRRREASDPADGAAMVARFSTWATGALLVVVVAGMALAWVEVRTFRALVGAPYGWTLVVKAVTIGAVVAVGTYNNRLLVPAISRATAGERGLAWRRLRWTVRAEAVGLVAALAVTAVLVEQRPPRPHVEAPTEHLGHMDPQQANTGREAPP